MTQALSTAIPGSTGDLTIHGAAAHRELLLLALAESGGDGTAVLDLSQVSEFDSAGLQLLLALRCSLAKHQRTLRLDGVPRCVADVLDTYRLDATDLQPLKGAA